MGAGAAWKRIVCVVVIGLSMQVVISYLCDGVLSLLPNVAADYSELVEKQAWATRAIWPF